MKAKGTTLLDDDKLAEIAKKYGYSVAAHIKELVTKRITGTDIDKCHFNVIKALDECELPYRIINRCRMEKFFIVFDSDETPF